MPMPAFLAALERGEICFADTLNLIDGLYHYQPSAFDNGQVYNSAEQNQGSCKVLAMAIDQGLSDQQALQCFAEHYQSVLDNPDGSDHANIRALMVTGLAGVRFASTPLVRR